MDLDGTLTDPFAGISRCIIHALEAMEFPVPEPEDLKSWIGPPLRQSFERYLESLGGGDPDCAVRLYRERFSRTGLYENRLYDGISELMEQLHGHAFSLIVATSKPGVYASEIVRHFQLDRWLTAVHGSELDGSHSDKVDLLAYIVERESINPAESFMIGDREFDMRAARVHGLEAIGVLWGYGSPMELLDAGAGTLVSSPGELGELLIGTI